MGTGESGAAAAADGTTFAIRYEGHEISVRVEGAEMSAEHALVVVDGEPVRPADLTTRSHDLAFTTDDGIEIRLHVGGRSLDGVSGVRLRRADGYWVDLRERSGPGRAH